MRSAQANAWTRPLLGILAIALAQCTRQAPQHDANSPRTDEAGSSHQQQAPPAGRRAPTFELASLDGDTVSLLTHLGKAVILIDFWATSCEPCLVAMPEIEALYRKYRKQGFIVLGVSIDGPDSIAQVRAEVAKLQLSFPVLLDQETRVLGLYNARATAPYSVLIGRDGSVLETHEGYVPGDIERIEVRLRGALAH